MKLFLFLEGPLSMIWKLKKPLKETELTGLFGRGPEHLSVDGEMSIGMTREEVLELEIEKSH